MDDEKVTLSQLKHTIDTFMKQREWGKYHTPKNLSMDIAVEAAELMEHFLWVESKDSLAAFEKSREEISDEIADIAIVFLELCNVAHIDLASAIEKKLAKVAIRYPIEQVKGMDPFQLKEFKKIQKQNNK